MHRIIKENESIEFLENLEKGMFLTVNISIFRDGIKPITVNILALFLFAQNFDNDQFFMSMPN